MKRLTVCMTMVGALAVAVCASQEANAQDTLAPELQALEWHIGQWVHRGRTPEGKLLVVKRVCEPALGGHYLTAVTKIEVNGQEVLGHRHMVRWDSVRQEHRSWIFSSNGDFTTGRWGQIATQVSQGTLVGQTYDGKRTTATATYTRSDADTFVYRLFDHKVGGESRPDIEWDFHRVQPSP